MHACAVHFELTSNTTTEEFLNDLKHMINRQRLCHLILINNQATFKKADKCFKAVYITMF